MLISKQASRRRFLQTSIGGAAAIGVGTVVPRCFLQASESGKSHQDRVLVVIQMAGGNDGLNTVVPISDEEYYKSRPRLAIAKADAHRCDDETGLHPSLVGLSGLLDDGKLTVIRGVGYDNPNRSHFESMDIWHTCRRKDEQRLDGWLGRYLDHADLVAGGDAPAVHLGHEQQPFAIASQTLRVPTIRELAQFQLRGDNRVALRDLLSENQSNRDSEANELLNFLQSSTRGAIAASERVTQAATGYRSQVTYPDSGLAEKLRVIAQLIDAGLSTRVYYVQLDGFDTHSRQPDAHAALLREWSQAVTAFVNDLGSHDHGDRVCVMTFSEFGRRVAENASDGTDHGAAGPMFLCGGGLKTGIIGDRPNLTDLLDGDIKHTIDFRQVYASVLTEWLGADATSVLGKSYAALPLFG